MLWSAGLVSMAGDWMLRVALPIEVYRLTGSPLATSTMLMVSMLPYILLGSVAGVFVDRWDRRRTMVVTNLLLALGLVPLLAVRSAEWLWLAYVVAFVQASLAQFFMPAENALLPALVQERQLVTANSLNALNNNLARLLGPPIGGMAAGLVGLDGVALIDAATFLLAAGMVALIRVEARATRTEAPSTTAGATGPWVRVWREWREGLELVRRERVLTVAFALLAVTAVGEGVMGALFVVFVSEVIGVGAREFGWMMGAQAIGGLAGGLAVGAVSAAVPPSMLIGVGAVLFGLLDLAIFNYPAVLPGYLPAIILFALVGIPGVGFITGLTTLVQTTVADAYRGRVFGAAMTTRALLSLLGTALAGMLARPLGIVTMLNVQGAGYVVAGLAALVLLRGVRLPAQPQQEPAASQRGRRLARSG